MKHLSSAYLTNQKKKKKTQPSLKTGHRVQVFKAIITVARIKSSKLEPNSLFALLNNQIFIPIITNMQNKHRNL